MRTSIWLAALLATACTEAPGSFTVLPGPADTSAADPGSDGPTEDPAQGATGTPDLGERPYTPEEAALYARAEAADYVAQVEAERDRVASLRAASGCGGGAVAWRGAWLASIQDALDARAAGPILLVCPGTYDGPFTARAGDDVLVAPWLPGTVTLDGAGGSTLVSDATHLALVDLTFTGSDESAVVATGSAFAAIGSRFVGNTATYEGGALNVTGETVLIADSTFTDNFAGYGGGGAILVAPWTAVVDSDFEHNVADYEGGALEAYHAVFETTLGLLLTAGNHFERNHAGYEGGALVTGIRWTPLWAASLDDTFVDNTADYDGGSIQSSPSGGRYDVIGSTFSGGAGRAGGGVLQFGGWSTFDSSLVDVTITDCPVAPVAFAYQGDGLLPATVRIVRGVFERNGGAQVIAATRAWNPALPVRVIGEDVRFGSGADANAGRAVNACSATSGTLDFAFGGGLPTVCP